MLIRQLELDFVHGVKVLGNTNVLGAKSELHSFAQVFWVWKYLAREFQVCAMRSIDMEKWNFDPYVCNKSTSTNIFWISAIVIIYFLFNETNWSQVYFKIVSYSNEMWLLHPSHMNFILFFKMILFKKSITIFLVLAMMFQLFQIIQ